MSLADQAIIHPRNRAMMTASLMLATIIHWTDMTIAVVALPNLQGSLGASPEQSSWVITSFVVAAAITTPPAAFLASRFGRKNVFLFAVTIFTLASVACGLSQNLPELVFFRILQGAAGGLISPLTQATMLDAYPREKMGQAMATFGMGTMIGPILAPTVGGYLTEVHDWRWVFFINLPIGILTLLGVWRYVPSIQDMQRPRFDWLGFVLLCIAIAAFQLMLDRGVSKAWFQSPEIIVECGIALLCFYMFMVHILTGKNPFVSLAIFRDFNYSTTMVFSFLIGVTMLATMTLSPNFLQVLLGIPVMTTGLMMMPRSVAMMISMLMVGRMVNKVDPRLLILVGLLPMAYGFWGMAQFNLETGVTEVVVTGLWQGFGMGMIFTPMTVIAFATLNPQYRAEASGFMNLTRSIGSSIGISLMISLLAKSTLNERNTLLEAVTPYHGPFSMASPALGVPEANAAAAMLDGEVMRQATMVGYVNCFAILTILTLVTIPFVLILRKPPPLPTPGGPAPGAAPPPPAKAAAPQENGPGGTSAQTDVEGEAQPA